MLLEQELLLNINLRLFALKVWVSNDQLFQVTETGNLVIHSVQKSDDGEYICRAVNMVGSKDSEPAKLNVQGKTSLPVWLIINGWGGSNLWFILLRKDQPLQQLKPCVNFGLWSQIFRSPKTDYIIEHVKLSHLMRTNHSFTCYNTKSDFLLFSTTKRSSKRKRKTPFHFLFSFCVKIADYLI